MTVSVREVEKSELKKLISTSLHATMSDKEMETLENCLLITASVHVGLLNGKLVCTWGLVPPSLMSDQVYLWLYTTPELVGHEFLFVRHSQIAIRDILKSYTKIIGHTIADNEQAIRWLRWLGAEFEPTDGKLMNFSIRAKHG